MSSLACARRGARGPSDGPLASILVLLAPVWVLALGQSGAEALRVGSVAPELIVLAAATVSWTRPGFGAVAFAVFLGCCADVTSGVPWGLAAARLGLLAAIFSSLRQALATEVPGADVLVLGCFLIGDRVAHALILDLWIPQLDLGVALARGGWIALYTTALAPLALGMARLLLGEPEGRRRV